MPTKIKLDTLIENFRKAKEIDAEFCAEYRSFANLYAGNHFTKNTSAFRRFSRSEEKSKKNRIRVMRNHTNYIVKSIVNSLISLSPGVKPFPANPTETQDIKSAELHDAVWSHFKHNTKYTKRQRELILDLVIFGECWVFPHWDETAGAYLGDQQEIDAVTGEVINESPVFSGDVKLKKIMPYDIRRDPTASSIEECAWIGYVELRDIKELKEELPEELHKYLETEKEESYTTFDFSSGKYRNDKDKVELNHVFYRPSALYPKGAYATFTQAGKLFELDELPLGIFPLLTCGFDELPACARSTSALRVGKSYQTHINYLISQRIKTMLTLGDDKLILQAGTQVTQGEELPGIRALKVNGPAPTILAGRSGEQYQDSLDRTIQEYYSIMNVEEFAMDKGNGQYDPYAMLYLSAKQKSKFSLISSKVAEFQTDLCEVVLRLYKAHLKPDAFIKIAGRNEAVNIPEFKASTDLDYSIRLEEVSDDAETKLGKTLHIREIFQYAANELSQDQIGLFINELPYLNSEKMTESITQPYDRATNIILQLDRGETPQVTENDPHVDFIINSLYTRMSKADFVTMPLEIQQNYQGVLGAYEQIKAIQLQKAQQAEQGFIPTDGPSVPIDGLYTETVGSKGQPKSVRVKMPLSALQWLQETLQNRGQVFDPYQQMPLSLKAQIANEMAVANEQEPIPEDIQGGQQLPLSL